VADLMLHLKHRYFQEIKDGSKLFEYRLVNEYWTKRLVGREYDRVIFWDAYKPGGPETVMIKPYAGYSMTTITHEHFGKAPVTVFAIPVAC
jgi:hypothetical protein